MPRTMRALALLMLALTLLAGAGTASSATGASSSTGARSAAVAKWPTYRPSQKDYPQKVDFVVECYYVADRKDDPIVFPGQAGMSHAHTFSGNRAVKASSTAQSLLGAATTCKLSKDTASYWMPTIYDDGKPVYPEHSRAYYRAATFDGASIKPMPFGLKMIAGNAMAMKPQDARIAGFQCRSLAKGNTVPKRALPLRCAVGDFLESSVVFPNCWNGHDLDVADHRSHMAYADWKTHRCPAGYPVQIPQLTFANRYPVNALRGKITLARMAGMAESDSIYTLHSDVLDSWDPQMMARLTHDCINASVACADVSDRRLPPHRP